MRLSNATYALGLLWIPLIFAYPGPKELGLLSDNVAGYAMFGICVTQYVTVKLVTKQILEAQQSQGGLN